MPATRDETPADTLDLSIVLCGYNEESNIEAAVGRVRDACEQIPGRFEIIVVNDGSTDATGAIADKLAAGDARIRVIHNPRNLNYGRSLMRGIRAARCEWILHDGMDLPLAPEDIRKFLPHLEDADVIVVCRTDRSAHSHWRTLTSLTNNALLRALFFPRARDLNFVQFYRRSFVQRLKPVSTAPASVTPELILRAEKSGAQVSEVSAIFRRRPAGKGHFGRPKDILWTLSDMFKLRLLTWLRGWEQ